jgi:putative hydrolase of the HAD superfamily
MQTAFFFDLVGTLIRAAQPIGEQYAGWARRHGAVEADPERMGAAFRAAMRRAPAMAFPGLAGLDEIARAERRWWAELVRSVLAECGLAERLKGERFDAFFADLYDHFTTANAWVAYEDVRPALERLKGEGLVVGLITNYDTRVYPVLDALALSTLLDSVTIPALAGSAKPHRGIFDHALATHGLRASQATYVGDEIDDDYRGAEGAGMAAVLVDREGTNGGRGLRTIRSLSELTGGGRIQTPRRTP